MTKNHDIRVRYSSEELTKLKKKAELLGMAVSSFVRFISLKAEVKVE
jgi:predicted DNA binding CopG/RHH family protein